MYYLLHFVFTKVMNPTLHLSEHIGYEDVADLLLQLPLWEERGEEGGEPPGPASRPLKSRGEGEERRYEG